MKSDYTPRVSFAIASYNSSAFLEAAVRSALDQSDVSVEVLIVDDGSSDDSRELAERLAQEDSRVRALATPSNGGPAAARNVALTAMRGEWFAVLDSDDMLAPERTESLLELAERHRADLVADDLRVFSDDPVAGESFLGEAFAEVASLSLEIYLQHSVIYGNRPNFGFLKPMIRKQFLDRHAIHYDERMRIGEDDRLILACLLAGGRYAIGSHAGYYYRKHDRSISHRLGPREADTMRQANDELASLMQDRGAPVRKAFGRRAASYRNAAAFAHAIAAIKHGRADRSLAQVIRNPGTIPLFMMPIRSRLARIGTRNGRTKGGEE
ncbi:glycosyltransferase family 2 protein [Qipengyuania qiaonensis]|uniref:Glycosyltransferase n=1 Tax=Qipengyuania qiaonensis TaxID=2867240 RepID=A0ABS7JCV4_9SPHN|nr:glycosyltransferase family 2 protein [Qipengyuania qiaonensis]MBX7483659.1 glycosyltransferase [Qipengyuania qiaonensis]